VTKKYALAHSTLCTTPKYNETLKEMQKHLLKPTCALASSCVVYFNSIEPGFPILGNTSSMFTANLCEVIVMSNHSFTARRFEFVLR
jgi:hypothetical protein